MTYKKLYIILIIIIFYCTNLAAQSDKIEMAYSLDSVYTWDKYPSYSVYTAFMEYYSGKYGDICTLDTIGYTNEGRLLLCMQIASEDSRNNNCPKFFYSSAMHGNELTGSVMLMHIIDTLVKDRDLLSSLGQVKLYVCPFANPDGTWYGGNDNVTKAVRYNANHVDLNRNYPVIGINGSTYGGNLQQETKAFIQYQLKNKFDMGCNIHTGSEVFNYPWDAFKSYEKEHADKTWFETIGKDFVNDLNDDTRQYFKAVCEEGYIDGGDWYVVRGSRQDWSTYYAHCREVTLEVSKEYMPPSYKLSLYWTYLKDALFTFFKYTSKGISGSVSDSVSGYPLDGVMITVKNHDKDSSEVFSDGNGYFFRPLLEGVYDISFTKDGYHEQTLTFNCGDYVSFEKIELVPYKTGEDEIAESCLKIYPLPLDNVTYVYTDKKAEYKIFDMCGSELHAGELNAGENTVETESLCAGTYIIMINSSDGQRTIKKVVKK